MKYLFLVLIFIASCGGDDSTIYETRGEFTQSCETADCSHYADVFCSAFEECNLDIVQVTEAVSYDECVNIVNKYHFKPSDECVACYESMNACDLVDEPNVCQCPMCYPSQEC